MATQRQREEVPYPMAARASTPDPVAYGNYNAESLVVVITLGANGSGVVVNIEGIDPATKATYPILASASLTTAGQTVLRVWKEMTPATNLAAQDMLPAQFRIRPVHSGSATYAIGVIIGGGQ